MKKNMMFSKFFVIFISFLTLISSQLLADVVILRGPSPIDGDVLNHPDDITIYNDKVAFTFAVGSPNFWGMTNGSISNIALMNGREDFGVNIVNDVQFLVNSWTASGGSLVADVEIIKDSKEKGIIQAKSTWLGDGKENPLEIITSYTLEKDSSILKINTVVYNPGPDTYTDLRSGYSMSGLAAYMFGPFGYHTPDVRARNIAIGTSVGETFGDFVVSYQDNYAITLQMDGTEIYRGTTGYKDLHKHYNLKAQETMNFSGELQVIDNGHTSPFIERMIEKKSLNSARISGVLRNRNNEVHPQGVIVVEKKGEFKGSLMDTQYLASDELHSNIQTFAWHRVEEDGTYSFELPEGEYYIYAVAAGYRPSRARKVNVRNNRDRKLNFTRRFSIEEGGTVNINVFDKDTKEAIDARIEVDGPTPAVKYLGAKTYFTDLENIGEVSIDLSIGEFNFNIMSGANFFTKTKTVGQIVQSKKEHNIDVYIRTKIDPRKENWYSVDLHQHTDIGDGNTSPKDLVKSNLASRLDVSVVSDHDSVDNNIITKEYSKKRQLPFIPSLEISPGWGHFNVLPMELGSNIIDPSLSVVEIIDQVKERKALITVNHPYTDYGYFNNMDIAPGGFDNRFDLIELQPTIMLGDKNNPDRKTLEKAMEFWTNSLLGKNKKYYLVGASDSHDVTSSTLYSGIMRSFAKVEGDLTVEKLISSIANGHSYLSMGPLFFTDEFQFGNTYTVNKGDIIDLSFEAFAVNGLDSVSIYSKDSNLDEALDEISYNSSKKREKVEFQVEAKEDNWYILIGRDSNGRLAISNPVWISVK